MPRRKSPIKETPAWDILKELIIYVDREQRTPNEHALYAFIMIPKGYEMTLGEFRYYFHRLQQEGYIEVDENTRAVKLSLRLIVPTTAVTSEYMETLKSLGVEPITITDDDLAQD